MAGKSEEEDYLSKLLENAMIQDAELAGNDNQIDIGFSEEELSETEKEILDSPAVEDSAYEMTEPETDANLASAEETEENSVSSDALPEEALPEDDSFLEDVLADMAAIEDDGQLHEPEDFPADMPEETSFLEEEDVGDEGILAGDFLDELKGIVEAEPESKNPDEAVADQPPEAMERGTAAPADDIMAGIDGFDLDELIGGYENSDEGSDGGLDDILALDEGVSFPDTHAESGDGLMPGEGSELLMTEAGEPEDASAAAEPDDGAEAENVKGRKDKGKKAKKEKTRKAGKAGKDKKAGGETSEDENGNSDTDKPRKKFSIKNFFLDYDDEGTEGNSADANQQLIDELYEGKSSLDGVDPNDMDSPKKKKEKKPKQKKEKAPKPPKPRKAKAPKEKSSGGGFNAGAFIKAVFIAAVVTAVVVVGSKLFIYKSSVKSAGEYFDAGNYTAAYDKLSGLNIKKKDNELYMKVRTVMIVYQGLESYENYIAIDDVPHALDALILSVGRKNRNEGQAAKYGVTNEVETVYRRIIGMLDRYGISEEQALDYFTMTDYKAYFEILEDIGGRRGDSGN